MMTFSECLERYGSRYGIKKKIDAGELFLIEKGIYAEKPYVPELAILSHKYPHAVLTMRNAFYFHNLTDTIPDHYDYATQRNASKISDKRIKQFFYPDSFFNEGAESYKYQGYDIIVYSRERMLIELFRYKSKLPYDYYKEILLNYRKIVSQLNIQKIQDYAIITPKSDLILERLQTEVF